MVRGRGRGERFLATLHYSLKRRAEEEGEKEEETEKREMGCKTERFYPI